MLTRNELGLLAFRDHGHTSQAGMYRQSTILAVLLPHLMIDNSARGHESDHWKLPRLVEFAVF